MTKLAFAISSLLFCCYCYLSLASPLSRHYPGCLQDLSLNEAMPPTTLFMVDHTDPFSATERQLARAELDDLAKESVAPSDIIFVARLGTTTGANQAINSLRSLIGFCPAGLQTLPRATRTHTHERILKLLGIDDEGAPAASTNESEIIETLIEARQTHARRGQPIVSPGSKVVVFSDLLQNSATASFFASRKPRYLLTNPDQQRAYLTDYAQSLGSLAGISLRAIVLRSPTLTTTGSQRTDRERLWRDVRGFWRRAAAVGGWHITFEEAGTL